jgi:L-lactate dehydrogenase complex protein LldG
MSGGREEILTRVRDALKGRATSDHPGAFGSWRPARASAASPVERLTALLQATGSEVMHVADDAAGYEWLERFSTDFASVAIGTTVPEALRPTLPRAAPDVAPLGVSMARGAVADTGSLLLDARDGRRAQLLPPTHVVFVRIADIHATFRDALLVMRDDLPSAIGLHSGPSRSADIGQVMVKGVHGPGRLIAVILGSSSARAP